MQLAGVTVSLIFMRMNPQWMGYRRTGSIPCMFIGYGPLGYMNCRFYAIAYCEGEDNDAFEKRLKDIFTRVGVSSDTLDENLQRPFRLPF